MVDFTAPVPCYLRSARRRWLSLIVVCFAMAVANGPVMCWQTLMPIMIESEGAFASTGRPLFHLDAVFAVGNGIGALSNLPAGMVYDRIGPRRAAVAGALGTSVGLGGLALCLSFPSLNWGMYIFYPIATVMAFLNSWGAFAYLWLLPEHPSLVNAMVCAAFSLSDTLGMVAVQLHRNYGLPLHAFFVVLACGALLAAVISTLLLPDKHEFTRLAAEAKAHMALNLARKADAAGKGAGAAADKEAGGAAPADEAPRGEPPDDDADGRCARAALGCLPPTERTLLRDTAACVTLLHPQANRAILAHLLGLYLLPMTLLLKQYGYYLALLGEPDATELVNLFSLILGFCGAASVIGFGLVSDVIGVVGSFVVCDSLALLFAAVVLLRSRAAQIVGMVLLTFMANAFFVLAPRLAMLYTPSELFGTYSGGVFSLLGLSQLVTTPIVDGVAYGVFYALPEATRAIARYQFGIVVWAIAVVATAPALYRHWWRKPPPGTGRAVTCVPGGGWSQPLPTMADVREARWQRARSRAAPTEASRLVQTEANREAKR